MFFRPWSPLHLCLHILCRENCIQIVYDKMLRGIVVNDNLIGSVAVRSFFHGNAAFFANFRWPFRALSVWCECPFHHSNFREPREDS